MLQTWHHLHAFIRYFSYLKTNQIFLFSYGRLLFIFQPKIFSSLSDNTQIEVFNKFHYFSTYFFILLFIKIILIRFAIRFTLAIVIITLIVYLIYLRKIKLKESGWWFRIFEYLWWQNCKFVILFLSQRFTRGWSQWL